MFCDECLQTSNFGTVMRKRDVLIQGVTIQVQYRAEVCRHCGAERYNEQTEVEILRHAKELYRSQMHLLPVDRIRKYMSRNHLTPEQMAEKVGCATSDILSAANGAIISTEVDKKLREAISA